VSVRFEEQDGLGRIVIDRPDDRVNAIDLAMVNAFGEAVRAARESKVRGVVVASAKPDQFVGGADLEYVRRAGDPALVAVAVRAMQRVLDELAGLPATTVAAIGGAALGGGCEVALACDWRVAADSPAVRIGQPEVQLGLIPAAGGTQRLPRLVGLPRALDLILASRRLSARRARRAGLVDEVVHPALLERAAADRARRARKRKPEGGATPGERAVTWLAPARRAALSRARSRVLEETRGRYPAALKVLETIEIGLRDGMEAGLAAEVRAFTELATSETAHNLVALLLMTLRQRHEALRELPEPRPVRRLGVVGAGFMGSGIAQAGAVAGMAVRVRDVDHAAVARGLGTVQTLTLDAAKKGVFERREAERIVSRVSGAPDFSGFGQADLVIEAVFEEIELKRSVVAELESVVRDQAVIASNTSALPIAGIARNARCPERVLGMHFFSPVHRMPLLEVIAPPAADKAAVATAVAAGQAMGKTVIVVGDSPGFYTTRVLGLMVGEAALALEEGLRIEEVDAEMERFGWPVGPFRLLDEIGLVVAKHVADTVGSARGIGTPRAVPLLVAEGLQGKRGGKGFYVYSGKRRTPNKRVYKLLGVTARPTQGDVAERLTLAFVNEAARCLDEGVLRSPAEGDLGAVLGLGFPPYLGGPFRYADTNGEGLRDSLQRLADAYGERFTPADSLREGRRFFAE
jgi:3-hydroxyacyl-CoA dehydrogenase/enoyl-CoA hydratase/3-hydroxybutyryl-CoA epimerase